MWVAVIQCKQGLGQEVGGASEFSGFSSGLGRARGQGPHGTDGTDCGHIASLFFFFFAFAIKYFIKYDLTIMCLRKIDNSNFCMN